MYNKYHISYVNNFDFKEVSENNVRTTLQKLALKKSPGYDYIHSVLFDMAA